MSVTSDASFEAAFDGLFELAFRVALHLLGSTATAEDVAAEALTRAYVRWRKIGDKDWIRAWVVRVATNIALDVYRREQRPRGPSSGRRRARITSWLTAPCCSSVRSPAPDQLAKVPAGTALSSAARTSVGSDL